MKLAKRPVTQNEVKQLARAIWNHWNDVAPYDQQDTTEKDIEEYILENYYKTCLVDAETAEPLFIVLELHEDMLNQGDLIHQEVFEWQNGELQYLEHIEEAA